jgi:hypothetical protein
MNIMRDAVNLSPVLAKYHKDAEKLISWACVQHRGFVATTNGACKIDHLPWGTHQFVLANSSPRLESDFMSRLSRPNAKTTVLYHGTGFDRLPAILAQGLRVCSGTPLQSTGAAHGKGIYLAEEPATSLSYSHVALTWRNSGLNNMRLLLGCEVVGTGNKVGKGIHLITDPASVMVRFLFLFPAVDSEWSATRVSQHMAVAMSNLRTGEV